MTDQSSFISVAVVLASLTVSGSDVCAADRAQAQTFANGTPGDGGRGSARTAVSEFDAFSERLFGASSEQDQKALEAINVSLTEEVKLGKQMVDAYLRQMKQQRIAALTNGQDVEYLQNLTATLKPLMKNADRYKSIRIIVLKTRQCEARSFPGGTLVFSRGLLALAGSEAAIVGVIGHELSHLDRGHQLLPIRRMKLLKGLADGKTPRFSPNVFLSTGPLLMRLSRPFRPEEEQTADGDGVTWTYQAGYHPHAFAELFLKFDRKQKDPDVPVPSMFRSHPRNRERYQAVLARYEELQRADPNPQLYVGIENLRRRTPKSTQVFPE